MLSNSCGQHRADDHLAQLQYERKGGSETRKQMVNVN
jgi:hypothetical protein